MPVGIANYISFGGFPMWIAILQTRWVSRFTYSFVMSDQFIIFYSVFEAQATWGMCSSYFVRFCPCVSPCRQLNPIAQALWKHIPRWTLKWIIYSPSSTRDALKVKCNVSLGERLRFQIWAHVLDNLVTGYIFSSKWVNLLGFSRWSFRALEYAPMSVLIIFLRDSLPGVVNTHLL